MDTPNKRTIRDSLLCSVHFLHPPASRSGTTKIKLQATFSLYQIRKMRAMGMSYFLWAVKLILVDVCLPKDELAAFSSTLDIFEG